MKLELLKDELKNNVADYVKEEAKTATVGWIKTQGLPAAREVAASYTEALQASAKDEHGWNRFRDRIFLPVLIDGALWLTDKALDHMTPPV